MAAWPPAAPRRLRMCSRDELDLALVPDAPALGRRFALARLDAVFGMALPLDVADDVALVVSELVTNAVRAQARRIRLALAVHRREIDVVVTDDAPGTPTLTRADMQDTYGRGLLIVDALAATWGVEPGSDVGKSVWAVLRVPADVVPALMCDRAATFDLSSVLTEQTRLTRHG